MKRALSSANIKGRSAAKTREQVERLCSLHGLLASTNSAASAACSSSSFSPPQTRTGGFPPDMLCRICDRVASRSVQGLRCCIERVDAANEGASDEVIAKVSRTIMKNIDDTVRTLLALRLTSQYVAPVLHPHSNHWRELLHVFHQCSDMHCRDVAAAVKEVREGRLSPMRACVLVTTTGCEVCNAKRIRKVRWPFGMRCCDSCLKDMTISDFRIWERYRVNRDQLRAHSLPFVSADLYAPRVGSYTLHFYMGTDVLHLLRRLHEIPFASLEEAYEHIHRDALAYGRAVERRNQEMFHAVSDAIRRSETSVDLNIPLPENIQGLRWTSSSFDAACKKPPNDAPHLLPPRRGHFLDRVAAQYIEPVLKRRGRDRELEYEKYERDVERPWVRALLFDRAEQKGRVVYEEEDVVDWAFVRLKARTQPTYSDRLAAAGLSKSVPPHVLDVFDSDRAMHEFQAAISNDDSGTSEILDQALKLSLIIRQLKRSKLGIQLVKMMHEFPCSSDTRWYIRHPHPDPHHHEQRTYVVRFAEIVLRAHGPSYEPDGSDLMLLDALPSLNPIFPQGVLFNEHNGTFACPCGRMGLRSIRSFVDHLRGSIAHR